MDMPAYLRKIVTVLAREFGFRSYRDAARLEKAADFIFSQFTSLGYQATKQSFLFREKTYHNIIAELTGRSSPEKRSGTGR